MKLKFTGEELANHAEARCAFLEQERKTNEEHGFEAAAEADRRRGIWFAVLRDHIDRGAEYELTLEDIERLEFGQ